jgi:hypothetical protein
MAIATIDRKGREGGEGTDNKQRRARAGQRKTDTAGDKERRGEEEDQEQGSNLLPLRRGDGSVGC